MPWVTLEGGETGTFPLSINQSSNWLKLRRGECSAQVNVSHENDGVFAYAKPPSASPNFFAKRFAQPDATPQGDEITKFWAYGRWWRVSLAANTQYRLEYTTLTDLNTFNLYTDFNDDGDDAISTIATDGEGVFYILKPKCAYRLLNANVDGAFRKTAAYYGMGCVNPGPIYSNAVIAGNVVATWNGGGASGVRHYMWNGVSGAVELSRNVRDLAKDQQSNALLAVNWAENLVISPTLVYDLDNKRVFNYSATTTTAEIATRPYRHPKFHPILIEQLAFYCDGESGSFRVSLEYGQSFKRLNKTETRTVTIRDQDKVRFRFPVSFERNIQCRVWRLHIDQLSGVGIVQIDAKVDQPTDGPEGADDVS